MTILILCAGESKRFKWEGISKHRLPVFGEELLSRTVRQCKDRVGYTDEISIVTNDFSITDGLTGEMYCYREKDDDVDYSIYTPEKYDYICQTLKSTRNIWGDDRTIVLLGDVLYSEYIIDRVFSKHPPILFYGSIVHKEIYALAFTDKPEIIWALDRVDERVVEGFHGQLWQLFYVLNKLPGHRHPDSIPYRMFRHVYDFTQDFDTVEDYEKFLYFKEKIYKEEA